MLLILGLIAHSVVRPLALLSFVAGCSYLVHDTVHSFHHTVCMWLHGNRFVSNKQCLARVYKLDTHESTLSVRSDLFWSVES